MRGVSSPGIGQAVRGRCRDSKTHCGFNCPDNDSELTAERLPSCLYAGQSDAFDPWTNETRHINTIQRKDFMRGILKRHHRNFK